MSYCLVHTKWFRSVFIKQSLSVWFHFLLSSNKISKESFNLTSCTSYITFTFVVKFWWMFRRNKHEQDNTWRNFLENCYRFLCILTLHCVWMGPGWSLGLVPSNANVRVRQQQVGLQSLNCKGQIHHVLCNSLSLCLFRALHSCSLQIDPMPFCQGAE